jgi:hypothetical protein
MGKIPKFDKHSVFNKAEALEKRSKIIKVRAYVPSGL